MHPQRKSGHHPALAEAKAEVMAWTPTVTMAPRPVHCHSAQGSVRRRSSGLVRGVPTIRSGQESGTIRGPPTTAYYCGSGSLHCLRTCALLAHLRSSRMVHASFERSSDDGAPSTPSTGDGCMIRRVACALHVVFCASPLVVAHWCSLHCGPAVCFGWTGFEHYPKQIKKTTS